MAHFFLYAGEFNTYVGEQNKRSNLENQESQAGKKSIQVTLIQEKYTMRLKRLSCMALENAKDRAQREAKTFGCVSIVGIVSQSLEPPRKASIWICKIC